MYTEALKILEHNDEGGEGEKDLSALNPEKGTCEEFYNDKIVSYGNSDAVDVNRRTAIPYASNGTENKLTDRRVVNS